VNELHKTVQVFFVVIHRSMPAKGNARLLQKGLLTFGKRDKPQLLLKVSIKNLEEL